uniref:F-box protein AT5G49610-like beta-propeller domain-containing protein n=1 Tax=Leersia perrieri TaxID=77586 RepID=A0A0D9VEY3_9ORYZ
MSAVLGNDDLLGEILLRLGLPTTLVRAAAVSTRWLRLASDRAFLRRFRRLHPPRLLGFYHTSRERYEDELPIFIPLPQPPELDVALRRAVFLLPGAAASSSPDNPVILDCRNGRILAAEFPREGPRARIFSPMHPAREPPVLPLIHELPRQPGQILFASCILLPEEDGGDDLSYTLVEFLRRDQEIFAKAISVKAGVLDVNVRESPSMGIQECTIRNTRRTSLFNGNVYLLGEKEHILGLNLASMRLFLIKFPDGVEQLDKVGNIELLRADDSGLYLLHLKGFQLHVWLYTSDSDTDIGGTWELVDTICLRQSFGQVAEPNWESGDALVALHRVEDNVEVFLRVDLVFFHIHIMNRTVKKVFEISPKAYKYFDIFPVMMLWPPTFPQLTYDHDQGE